MLMKKITIFLFLIILIFIIFFEVVMLSVFIPDTRIKCEVPPVLDKKKYIRFNSNIKCIIYNSIKIINIFPKSNLKTNKQFLKYDLLNKKIKSILIYFEKLIFHLDEILIVNITLYVLILLINTI
jgi:hypothetical protein